MAQNQLGLFTSSCRVEPIIKLPRAKLCGTGENRKLTQAGAQPQPLALGKLSVHA